MKRTTVAQARARLDAVAASYGATIHESESAYEADAPAGMVWKLEELQSLVSLFAQHSSRVPAAWRIEACNDLVDRMQACGGVEPGEPQ